MGKPPRVLLVLEPGASAAVEDALQPVLAGTAPLAAAGLEEALELLDANDVDVVLAQQELPDGTGLELLGRVREDGSRLPVILVDPDGRDHVARQAVDLDATGYIPEPLEGETLDHVVDRIDALVRLRRRDQGAGDEQGPGDPARRRIGAVPEQCFTQELLDAFPDAVYVIGPDGALRQWNEAVAEVTGYDHETIGTLEATAFFPEDEQHRVLEAIDDALETGESRFEAQVVTADGDRIPYEFVSAAMADHRGGQVIVGIGRDVAERKERERRVERQRDQLEILNRLIRHDIKNDMMVVVGLTEMLRDEVPAELRDDVDRVLGTGKHTLEMTEVARVLVEIIRMGGELGVEATSLAPTLLQEVHNARRSFPAATVDVDDPPKVQVQANRLLGAVFRNVLNNAVQHNDKDAPRVHVASTVGDDRVTVRIADNGPGIPDSAKETLFDRKGTGLTGEEESMGLYLVGTLVEQCGGTIRVQDNEPEGTVIVIELPRAG